MILLNKYFKYRAKYLNPTKNEDENERQR